MKMFLNFAFLLSFLLFLLSCANNDNRINELESKVQESALIIDSLSQRLHALETEFSYMNLVEKYRGVVRLSPSDEGYSTVEFDLGVLTISIKNIIPYADGSKVTLEIGNTLSSTITGLEAALTYGTPRRMVDPWAEVDTSSSPSQKKSITMTKKLQLIKPLIGGSWTQIDVNLQGIPPNELDYIKIENIQHSGIRLRR